MKRLFLIASSAAAVVAIAAVLSESATAQAPTPIPSVWLQTTSPGTTQTGNLTVSGTVKANSVVAINSTLTAGSFSSTVSTGLSGTSTATNGTGVRGTANTTGGVGVRGSGDGNGVFGTTLGPGASGVFGEHPDTVQVGYGVRGRATNTFSWGGLFENVNLGDAFDVELAGPNGAISTSGFLYREYASLVRSAAIPIAYGNIGATGNPPTINSGTGNFTVTHAVTGEYEITLDGETYNNTAFTVIANVNVNSVPYVACVADGGTSMRINIWNLGTGAKTDFSFNFVVFKANPNEPGMDGYTGPPENNGGTGKEIFRRPKS